MLDTVYAVFKKWKIYYLDPYSWTGLSEGKRGATKGVIKKIIWNVFYINNGMRKKFCQH